VWPCFTFGCPCCTSDGKKAFIPLDYDLIVPVNHGIPNGQMQQVDGVGQMEHPGKIEQPPQMQQMQQPAPKAF
jgi:hypothetical protein